MHVRHMCASIMVLKSVAFLYTTTDESQPQTFVDIKLCTFKLKLTAKTIKFNKSLKQEGPFLKHVINK